MTFSEIAPYIRSCRRRELPRSFRSDMGVMGANRILFIEGGIACLNDGDREYALGENDMVYIPAGCGYSLFCNRVCKMLVLDFDLTQKRSGVDIPLCTQPFDEFDMSLIPRDIPDGCEVLAELIVVNDAVELSELIARICYEFETKITFWQESCQSLTKLLLCEIQRSCLAGGTKARRGVETMLSYISENYQNTVTNTDLAEVSGYHKHYTNELMNFLAGTTLRQYLIEYRAKRACELLESSDLSLTKVAQKCGLLSSSYLCRTFKAVVGISPLHYRFSKRKQI
jgi:AraC-like DNA-binding protein